MKKFKKVCFLAALTVELFASKTVSGQATDAGFTATPNIGFGGQFLGYTNNFPLNFRTNSNSGAVNRMIIVGGGAGVGAGRIAMGNNLPNAFAPQDRLHLNQTAGQTFMRFTNNLIGTGAGNGFRVGIMPNGTARLMQLQNQAMQFWIFDQNPSIGGVTRRAEFTAGNLLI